MADSAQIIRVSYTHDAMIDLMIAKPFLKQGELAAHFGYTPQWVSVVVNSDAFKERLHERRKELVDPVLTASIEEKMSALAQASLDNLLRKAHTTPDDSDLALETLKVTSRALGYGARAQTEINVQQQFVAVVPQRSVNSRDWVDTYSDAHKTLEMPKDAA